MEPNNPGPGYHDAKKITHESPKFSLRKRIDFDHFTTEGARRNVPGPGTYDDNHQLSKTGTYVLSGLKNSQATRWNK